MIKPNSLMINKLLSIIAEEEGKTEGEGLSNCCRWKSSRRRGLGGGGGAWSRRWFPSVAVKTGRTAQFPGAVVKAGRTARFPDALMWRRNEALAWRRTEVPTCRSGEAHVKDAEEGVWRENDRVTV
jgi:hypothetical protein